MNGRSVELLENIDKGIVQDIHEDAANYNLNSTSWLKSVRLVNNGASNVTLAVTTPSKTLTAVIKPNEIFDECFPLFKQLAITATTSYRLIVRG